MGRISFAYFDGSEWMTEWDTASMGMLPVAVRVEIAMIPRQKKGRLAAGSDEPFIEDPKHIYSMVVFLPSSQAARANSMPASSSEETDETGEESSDTSGTSSGTGTTGGTGTSGTGGTGTGGSGSGTSGMGGTGAGGSGTGGTTGKPSGGTGTGTDGTSKRGG